MLRKRREDAVRKRFHRFIREMFMWAKSCNRCSGRSVTGGRYCKRDAGFRELVRDADHDAEVNYVSQNAGTSYYDQTANHWYLYQNANRTAQQS
jgi:hypothetical protein